MSHPEATYSHQNHVSGVTAAETHQNKPGGQMSDRIETVIAEAHAAHVWRGTILGCSCNKWNWHQPITYACGEEDRIERAHSVHVATAILAALKAARIAVVPLADPLEREDGEDEIADTWERVGEFRVSVHDAYPDEVALSYDFEPYEPFSPREARELAAELLAAADVADAAAVGARITVEEQ